MTKFFKNYFIFIDSIFDSSFLTISIMFASSFKFSRTLILPCAMNKTRAFSLKQTPSLFTKMAVIGGGNMAEAVIAAIKASESQVMSDVVVVDINKNRLKYLNNKYGVSTTQDANDAVTDAEMMV